MTYSDLVLMILAILAGFAVLAGYEFWMISGFVSGKKSGKIRGFIMLAILVLGFIFGAPAIYLAYVH